MEEFKALISDLLGSLLMPPLLASLGWGAGWLTMLLPGLENFPLTTIGALVGFTLAFFQNPWKPE
tara:strand:+ start:1270 stop:1464 length:195 start_codon:yes stop_codon:yes gene_type:complete